MPSRRIVLALLIAVPAAAAFVVAGVAPGMVDRAWWPPATAALVALGLMVVLRRNLVLVLVAGALGALAARSAADGRVAHGATDGLELYDLTDAAATGAVPEPAPPYVRVRGYYRGSWTLDEYAVARGVLPDQAENPNAVLVPFVGSQADTIESPTDAPLVIVVARVAPGTALEGTQAVELTGKTAPLDPDVLRTLVRVAGSGAKDARGLLVDTQAVPKPADAWTDLGIAALALLIAAAAVWTAAAPKPDTPQSS